MALVTSHQQPAALVGAFDRLGAPNTVAGLPLPRFLEAHAARSCGGAISHPQGLRLPVRQQGNENPIKDHQAVAAGEHRSRVTATLNLGRLPFFNVRITQ